MNAMLGLLIPALLGVDYGWDRKPDGTIAYIVQVDAETFAEMQRTGQTIGSSLPPNLRSRVSDFSFRVGSAPLPNHNTLPPEATSGSTLTPVTANYPPQTYSSNNTNAATPQSQTTRWGGEPGTVPSVSIPTSSIPPANASWAQNTMPASSATTQPPLSTSGFPINPNAPPPAPGVYPNVPTSGTSGAYPAGTSPPSLNNGPRIAQPSPWSAPPREVTISARMPQEPNAPLTSTPTMPTTGPNMNPPAGNFPANNQPGFNNNGYANNAGYQQPNGLANPQYAQNNYPPANGTLPLPPPPGYQQNNANPNAAGQPNDPYFNQRQQQQDPRSATHTAPPATATTNAAAVADPQWLPMTLVLIGFLTSLAANFYFGWSTYQLRERCRMMLTDRGTF